MIDRAPADKVLSKKVLPSFNLLIFLVCIVVGAAYLMDWDLTRAKAAARSEMSADLARMDKKFDDHITESKALREVMIGYKDDEVAARKLMQQNIYQLCLQTHAKCTSP